MPFQRASYTHTLHRNPRLRTKEEKARRKEEEEKEKKKKKLFCMWAAVGCCCCCAGYPEIPLLYNWVTWPPALGKKIHFDPVHLCYETREMGGWLLVVAGKWKHQTLARLPLENKRSSSYLIKATYTMPIEKERERVKGNNSRISIFFFVFVCVAKNFPLERKGQTGIFPISLFLSGAFSMSVGFS